MPIMVVRRGDVCPTTACEGTQKTHDRHETGQRVAGLSREDIPQSNERKPRPCDELEERVSTLRPQPPWETHT